MMNLLRSDTGKAATTWLFKHPFCLLESKSHSASFLEWLSYPDVCNYLIETKSEYTHEQLKTYKSLKGYNYLASGWINNITVTKSYGKSNYSMVTSSVKNSVSYITESMGDNQI